MAGHQQDRRDGYVGSGRDDKLVGLLGAVLALVYLPFVVVTLTLWVDAGRATLGEGIASPIEGAAALGVLSAMLAGFAVAWWRSVRDFRAGASLGRWMGWALAPGALFLATVGVLTVVGDLA